MKKKLKGENKDFRSGFTQNPDVLEAETAEKMDERLKLLQWDNTNDNFIGWLHRTKKIRNTIGASGMGPFLNETLGRDVTPEKKKLIVKWLKGIALLINLLIIWLLFPNIALATSPKALKQAPVKVAISIICLASFLTA